LIVIFITAMKMSLNAADKYGWVYNQTVIIGADISTEKVSISLQLFSEIFILMSGVMLITTGLEVSRQLPAHVHWFGPSNISFAPTKPTHWDISYDPHTHIVGVILDDVGITFPLSMFEKWAEKDTIATKSEEVD